MASEIILDSCFNDMPIRHAIQLYKVLELITYTDLHVNHVSVLRSGGDTVGWLAECTLERGGRMEYYVQAGIDGFSWEIEGKKEWTRDGRVYGYTPQRADLIVDIFNKYIEDHPEMYVDQYKWVPDQGETES